MKPEQAAQIEELDKLERRITKLAFDPNDPKLPTERQFFVLDDVIVGDKLGQGGYGIISSTLNQTQNSKGIVEGQGECALKQNFDTFRRGITKSSLLFQERCYRELRILDHFHHENLVSLLDVVPPKDFKSFEHVCFLMQLEKMDLHELINSKRKEAKSSPLFKEEEIQQIIYQILRGLKHLHSAKVLHRDLKPSNCLVDPHDLKVKICDFGLSRGIDPNDPKMSTAYVATRYYRAPELLMECDEGNAAIDMWAVGCILAEMFNGEALFPGKHARQLDVILEVLGVPGDCSKLKGKKEYVDYIMQYKHSETWNPQRKRKTMKQLAPTASLDALDLLEKMLTLSPDDRITVGDAMNHPFFSTMEKVDDPPAAPFEFEEFESQFKAKTLDPIDMKLKIYKWIIEREQNTMKENEQIDD